MDYPPNLSQQQRLTEKHRFKRLMAATFAGSGIVHGLAIGLVYLQPAQLNVPPVEPEIEIVLEDTQLPIDEPEAIEAVKLDDRAQVSGSSGGDAALQVATLAPPQAIEADPTPIDDTPIAPPEELTDADLQEEPKPQPTPKPKKLPQPEAPPKAESSEKTAENPIVPSKSPQAGEQNGKPDGSKERGLAETSGKGLGTGNTSNGNNGDGKQGKGPTNDGGKNNQTTPKPTPSPILKPSPKPSPTPPPQVAVIPSPKPPEPLKPTKPKPRTNFGYDRKEGERLATGTKARFTIEYDANGKVKGGKLAGSTGDAELDAAQLRDFNRALESNKKLRQQLENRDPEKRDRPIRFVFDGQGESAAEREQIQRNRELTAKQEAERAAELAKQAAPSEPSTASNPETTTPSGGIGIPIAPPAIVTPETPAATPVPVETPATAPVEPAPVEAPPEPAPIEAPPEPAPVEAPPPEPEPAPVEAPPEPAAEPLPVESPPESAPAEPAPAVESSAPE